MHFTLIRSDFYTIWILSVLICRAYVYIFENSQLCVVAIVIAIAIDADVVIR